MTLADENGFNILHHAVLKEVPGKVDYLIRKCSKIDKLTPEQTVKWTNCTTKDDGFTPLHYACYKSNIDALQSLLHYGADA